MISMPAIFPFGAWALWMIRVGVSQIGDDSHPATLRLHDCSLRDALLKSGDIGCD